MGMKEGEDLDAYMKRAQKTLDKADGKKDAAEVKKERSKQLAAIQRKIDDLKCHIQEHPLFGIGLGVGFLIAVVLVLWWNVERLTPYKAPEITWNVSTGAIEEVPASQTARIIPHVYSDKKCKLFLPGHTKDTIEANGMFVAFLQKIDGQGRQSYASLEAPDEWVSASASDSASRKKRKAAMYSVLKDHPGAKRCVNRD